MCGINEERIPHPILYHERILEITSKYAVRQKPDNDWCDESVIADKGLIEQGHEIRHNQNGGKAYRHHYF